VPSRWRVLAVLLQSTERKASHFGHVRSHPGLLPECRHSQALSVAVFGRRDLEIVWSGTGREGCRWWVYRKDHFQRLAVYLPRRSSGCVSQGTGHRVGWEDPPCVLGRIRFGFERSASILAEGLSGANAGWRVHSSQISHPIGRAIFVFAVVRQAVLTSLVLHYPFRSGGQRKVPDFMSRPTRVYKHGSAIDRSQRRISSSEGLSDPQYVVRRAIILRSIIERIRPDVIAETGRANN